MPDSPKKARPWDLFTSKTRVPIEIALERYEICKGCPELIQTTKTCKKCGCFMAAKTKLPHASCPLGKWDAIEVAPKEE
jgi:hypothetical protein